MTFAGVAILTIVALGASSFPARLAMRVDPVTGLGLQQGSEAGGSSAAIG
jgi:hypothetical protein